MLTSVNNFRGNIRYYRLQGGMTLAALAGKAGVSKDTLWKFEMMEQRDIRLGTAAMIAAALGMDLNTLTEPLAADRLEFLEGYRLDRAGSKFNTITARLAAGRRNRAAPGTG